MRKRINILKTAVILTAMILIANFAGAAVLPYTFVNKSAYTDDQVYVAIVGEIGGGHVWVDAATGEVKQMNRSDNTVKGPIIDGNMGPGGNALYADCFTKLSDIPNKTVDIPQIAGCRIMISFKDQLYLYFFGFSGDPSGYSAPNLQNPTDPNHGIKYELIELTYNELGLWCNTTRVDSYQYPMGLEVWGGNNFHKKVGELKAQSEILADWKATAPENFIDLLNEDEGMIQFPSKSSTFPAEYFDAYVNAIWTKYATDELVFDSGDAGVWHGRVSGENFVFTRESDSATATITGKPSTEEVMEGSGNMASGSALDKVVQAQICAAINRHAIDLTKASGVTQDFADEDNYYQTEPYNWYCKFFHRYDISYDSKTYTFCYDDVFDHSSTIHPTDPTEVKITIGGFSGDSLNGKKI